MAAQQEDPNTPRWDDPTWVQSFVDGKVNAVFSSTHPLPKLNKLPDKVKDALTHGGFVVLIEPWRIGCPTDPVNDINCNVGFIRSFTDWKEMYNTAYGAVEANPGHVGPWTDGSVHITYIREITADEMKPADWAAYAHGNVKVNFAENKPLPKSDPTDGAVAHMLVEPWRHTCIGLTTDLDCNVGKSGTFQTWEEMINYLSEGKWTRGSIISMPKNTLTGGNLPELVIVPAVEQPEPIESSQIQSEQVVATTLNPIFGFFTGAITWLMIGLALMYLAMLCITIWAVLVAWRSHWAMGLAMLFVSLVAQIYFGIIGTIFVLILVVLLLIFRPRFHNRTQIAPATPTPTPTPTATP
ncbi:MAG: hypothetical protein ABII80_01485 [bacterium]